MSAEAPLVAVYADESCLGNGKQGDNPGGAGVLLECLRPSSGELVRLDLWVFEPATTNNRMALRSAIEAFRALSRRGTTCRVTFTSDSRYLVDGMTSWVHGWARRGWRRSGGAIENLELWQEAVAEASRHEVEWRWVRGHAGHPQNEYANHLATRAAAQRSASAGLVPSEFDAWLVAQRARGAVRREPTPFPTAADFTASAPLPRVAATRP
ncbi:MAG TPA: ribonuclease H [Gemmatimonadaceae bacterium]|nr:ribonuclease H [Gemmatimonadaceae bacterium]